MASYPVCDDSSVSCVPCAVPSGTHGLGGGGLPMWGERAFEAQQWPLEIVPPEPPETFIFPTGLGESFLILRHVSYALCVGWVLPLSATSTDMVPNCFSKVWSSGGCIGLHSNTNLLYPPVYRLTSRLRVWPPPGKGCCGRFARLN